MKQPKKPLNKILLHFARRTIESCKYYWHCDKFSFVVIILTSALWIGFVFSIFMLVSCVPTKDNPQEMCANVYDQNGKITPKVLCKGTDGYLYEKQ